MDFLKKSHLEMEKQDLCQRVLQKVNPLLFDPLLQFKSFFLINFQLFWFCSFVKFKLQTNFVSVVVVDFYLMPFIDMTRKKDSWNKPNRVEQEEQLSKKNFFFLLLNSLEFIFCKWDEKPHRLSKRKKRLNQRKPWTPLLNRSKPLKKRKDQIFSKELIKDCSIKNSKLFFWLFQRS